MGSRASLPEVDLSDKTIVVTGANTGIGYETAKALAQAGAKVIIACRSESRANEALERMKKEHAEEKDELKKQKVHIKADDLNLEFMPLDLGSLSSTMTFVDAYKSKGYPLNVLLCNAGVAMAPEELTSDGFDPHFQINYLSHFLLILQLLPVLKRSGPGARVVSVSSSLYKFATWFPDDLQVRKKTGSTKRYMNTKAYQVMHMFSLAKRLEGSGVNVFSLHPGVVKTELGASRDGTPRPFHMRLMSKMLLNPFDGALTSLHAAANPAYDEKTALFFDSCKPTSVTSLVSDKEKQEILWKYSLDCLKDYITDDVMKELTSA